MRCRGRRRPLPPASAGPDVPPEAGCAGRCRFGVRRVIGSRPKTPGRLPTKASRPWPAPAEMPAARPPARASRSGARPKAPIEWPFGGGGVRGGRPGPCFEAPGPGEGPRACRLRGARSAPGPHRLVLRGRGVSGQTPACVRSAHRGLRPGPLAALSAVGGPSARPPPAFVPPTRAFSQTPSLRSPQPRGLRPDLRRRSFRPSGPSAGPPPAFASPAGAFGQTPARVLRDRGVSGHTSVGVLSAHRGLRPDPGARSPRSWGVRPHLRRRSLRPMGCPPSPGGAFYAAARRLGYARRGQRGGAPGWRSRATTRPRRPGARG